MSEVAVALNLPVKFADQASSVRQLLETGKLQRLRNVPVADVLTTALLLQAQLETHGDLVSGRAAQIVTLREVATGEHHCDDRPLIKELTRLIDPNATLAGLDLTSTLGKLGRLPIDATDQGPALELLDRLETMIAASPPIDLALFAEARGHVVRQAHQQQLGIAERIGDDSGSALFGVMDNANPAALALMMAETADACALALAEMKWGQTQMAALLHERLRWREKLLSRLSRTSD
jgi:hypothetical protein